MIFLTLFAIFAAIVVLKCDKEKLSFLAYELTPPPPSLSRFATSARHIDAFPLLNFTLLKLQSWPNRVIKSQTVHFRCKILRKLKTRVKAV